MLMTLFFGSTNKKLCEEFRVVMENKFEMSMIGEMNFFSELQIK